MEGLGLTGFDRALIIINLYRQSLDKTAHTQCTCLPGLNTEYIAGGEGGEFMGMVTRFLRESGDIQLADYDNTCILGNFVTRKIIITELKTHK